MPERVRPPDPPPRVAGNMRDRAAELRPAIMRRAVREGRISQEQADEYERDPVAWVRARKKP